MEYDLPYFDFAFAFALFDFLGPAVKFYDYFAALGPGFGPLFIGLLALS